MTAYLRRVNTWAAIAVVALTGWLVDSLVWFLESHPLSLAGLSTFLAHSWYALPLLGAIFVILRLRRPSELISLTIYDERGVPVCRQGDFRLEASVAEPIFAGFRGAVQENGLYHLELPTGPVIYFMRQGGLTLVACYSGPPRRAQLKAGLQAVKAQGTSSEDLLSALPAEIAALAALLLNAPVERDLLVHLWARRRMTMTAANWASLIGYREEKVASALERLEDLALVERLTVCDLTFYRLTEDEAQLARLDQFIDWRREWLQRAQRVEQLIGAANSQAL